MSLDHHYYTVSPPNIFCSEPTCKRSAILQLHYNPNSKNPISWFYCSQHSRLQQQTGASRSELLSILESWQEEDTPTEWELFDVLYELASLTRPETLESVLHHFNITDTYEDNHAD